MQIRGIIFICFFFFGKILFVYLLWKLLASFVAKFIVRLSHNTSACCLEVFCLFLLSINFHFDPHSDANQWKKLGEIFINLNGNRCVSMEVSKCIQVKVVFMTKKIKNIPEIPEKSQKIKKKYFTLSAMIDKEKNGNKKFLIQVEHIRALVAV